MKLKHALAAALVIADFALGVATPAVAQALAGKADILSTGTIEPRR